MVGWEEGTGRGLGIVWCGHGSLAHLPLHVNPCVVLHGMAGDEGLSDGWLTALSHVVGAVVVHEQGAQAASRDVSGEGEVLLIARVAAGQSRGCLWWLDGRAAGSLAQPCLLAHCTPAILGTALSPRLRGAERSGGRAAGRCPPHSPVLEQQRPQHVGTVLGPDLVGDDHLLHHLVSHPRQRLLVQVKEHSPWAREGGLR